MSQSIAFVLPSFAGGGAERVIVTLAAHLDGDRFAPALVVLDGKGPLAQSVPAGMPVHDLARPRLRYALPRLVATLRCLRPAAIVPTLGYLNLAVLALRPLLPRGVRILPREANIPSATLPRMPWPRAVGQLYRWLYPRADAVICPARAVADELIRDFAVLPERLAVLHNPVEADRIRGAASVPRRAPGAGVRFVAAGRLTPQKGFERLLDMFAELPEMAHLTVLGEGPQEPALRARTARLGIAGRVDFPGFDPVPWARYAGADAFLLPSHWEGMPNAALEALACGTPVIATPEAGGIVEVARLAETGVVTLAEAGESFTRALENVKPAPVGKPRPSLLPPEFRPTTVVRHLEELLVGRP